MKKIFLASTIFYFFLSGTTCIAQTNLHGLIVDKNDKPVASANVLLLNSKDSALVKGTISSAEGIYLFENIPAGKYLVASTMSGYEETNSSIFTISSNQNTTNLGKLSLVESAKQLDGVVVTASKKPLYEQKIDRMVINVAASITSAGSTALDVLERSPGVVVNHQNNSIAMNGKSGVVVMINGKINHMPLDAVMQMLAGMSSGNIEKIELITTPPANFDAEGNAGFINIVLKENNNFGTNGSFAATLGYGKGPVTGANFNLNHRKGKVNLYGDISYSRVKKPFIAEGYTKFYTGGNTIETYFTGDRTDTTRNINGRFGIDVEINKHTVVGALVSGYDNYYSQAELNGNRIVKNTNLDTSVKLSNSEFNHWSNYGVNLNLQHKFKENANLLVNLDYIHYMNNQPVQYFTSYYNNTGTFVRSTRTRSGKITPIIFWVGSIDYTKKLKKGMILEAGFKKTISAFTNDISLERLKQNAWTTDSSLSAKYKLDENYSAVYSSLSFHINKSTDVKMGLRYEYTNSNLGTDQTKDIVDRHYGNLFQSFFISHQLNKDNSVNFSYSMRITRPKITDLAPFTYYIDANTLLTGNPALQASVSNNFKANYIFKKYLFSVSYSREDNAITGFQPKSDSVNRKIVFTPENLDNQKTISAILSIPLTINKWWSMQYNTTGLLQQVNAFYKGDPVQFEQFNFQININQNFKLPKNIAIELSGFYQSPMLNGIFLTKQSGTVDLGIKKKLEGKKGSFFFNVSNIFNTLNFSGSAVLPEQNLNTNFNLYFSQRTYKLTYTRNFGKEKLKGKRERVTGAEEEKGRVQ